MTTLRIGSRNSALARAQSELVAAQLRGVLADTVVLVPIVSAGDSSTRSLREIGGTGVFVGAVRQALRDGSADIAVHSLKDLPTAGDASVVLAAVPARDDPRDALVARDGLTLGELPARSRVGTGSPRRAAQLNALGLGVEVVAIRGNVDTRIEKVRAGLYDAVVVARAGLARLGRADDATEIIDPIQMLPAPGQGALAVEVAAAAPGLAGEIAAILDDAPSRACVTAERALLEALEAGCSAPVGALAEYAEADDRCELWLRAVAMSHDGTSAVRRSATGVTSEPQALGRRLAASLLDDGAGELTAALIQAASITPASIKEAAR